MNTKNADDIIITSMHKYDPTQTFWYVYNALCIQSCDKDIIEYVLSKYGENSAQFISDFLAIFYYASKSLRHRLHASFIECVLIASETNKDDDFRRLLYTVLYMISKKKAAIAKNDSVFTKDFANVERIRNKSSYTLAVKYLFEAARFLFPSSKKMPRLLRERIEEFASGIVFASFVLDPRNGRVARTNLFKLLTSYVHFFGYRTYDVDLKKIRYYFHRIHINCGVRIRDITRLRYDSRVFATSDTEKTLVCL